MCQAQTVFFCLFFHRQIIRTESKCCLGPVCQFGLLVCCLKRDELLFTFSGNLGEKKVVGVGWGGGGGEEED